MIFDILIKFKNFKLFAHIRHKNYEIQGNHIHKQAFLSVFYSFQIGLYLSLWVENTHKSKIIDLVRYVVSHFLIQYLHPTGTLILHKWYFL